MNKYRVDGKQLILKLAPPKHKAPRQNRQQAQNSYDSLSYYRHPQVCFELEKDKSFFGRSPFFINVLYSLPKLLSHIVCTVPFYMIKQFLKTPAILRKFI